MSYSVKVYSTTNQTDIDALYFDYSKAFDSVPHNELLYKLWKYGVTGDLWLWFKSYLSSQMQCVKINQQFSGLLPVVSGVPQGSILGPLLFTLYINDLPQSLSVDRPYLFTDNTKCMHAIKDQTDHTSLPAGKHTGRQTYRDRYSRQACQGHYMYP